MVESIEKDQQRKLKHNQTYWKMMLQCKLCYIVLALLQGDSKRLVNSPAIQAMREDLVD